jgi:hypothetical protein
VQQRGHDAGTGAAERVPDGDRAAVDVDPVLVGLELVYHRDRLRRERLVDLEQVHLVQPPAGPAQGPVHRGHRPDAHVVRVHAGRGGARVPGQRPDAGPADRVRGHQQQGGGAVVQRRGIAAGDRAVLAEGRALGG